MTVQPRLLDPGPATGNLTQREETALAMLEMHPAGVRSSDLGAALHQALRKPCPCAADVRCKWALAEGERVGAQLRKRRLVVKRKASGKWQLLNPPVEGYDPATEPIPF